MNRRTYNPAYNRNETVYLALSTVTCLIYIRCTSDTLFHRPPLKGMILLLVVYANVKERQADKQLVYLTTRFTGRWIDNTSAERYRNAETQSSQSRAIVVPNSGVSFLNYERGIQGGSLCIAM